MKDNASRINEIVKFTACSDLEFRIEERLKRTFLRIERGN